MAFNTIKQKIMEQKITLWSILEVKVKSGTAKEAAKAHTKRRSIEECAETVAGFVHGETLVSTEDPNLMLVICGWEDEAAYEEWQQSSVRDKQVIDLIGLIEADMKESKFSRFHKVSR